MKVHKKDFTRTVKYVIFCYRKDFIREEQQKGDGQMKKNSAFGARLYSMFAKSVLIPALIAILCFGMYSNYTVNEREEQNIEDILSSVSQNLEIQFQEQEL